MLFPKAWGDSKEIEQTVLICILLSLSILSFTRPENWYIFGQDSISFANTLYYSQNPFYPYNNKQGLIYLDLAIYFFQAVFKNPAYVERLLVFVAVLFSLLGLSDLIMVIRKITGIRARLGFTIVPSLVFYLLNPYTLSVTWPHFLNWSETMIVAPFVVSYMISTIFNGMSIKRLSVTAIVLIVFSDSIAGSYLPFFLFIILVTLIGTAYEGLRNNQEKKWIAKGVFGTVLLLLLTVTWTFIPLYFSSAYSVPSNFSNSVLVQFFNVESKNTSFVNVVTLFAYGWIKSVPSAYPWIHSLNLLKFISALLILVLFYTILRNKLPRHIWPLFFISIFAVFFSIGNNPPFGFFNFHLLLLKGPFLFLINPFYFVIQYYVVFISVIIFFSVSCNFSRVNSKSVNFCEGWSTKISLTSARKRWESIFSLTAILIIVALLTTPFMMNQVYQERGNNSDIVNLNDGVLALNDFLIKNYSSPDYLSILLPMSSGNSSFLLYNNSSFGDSAGLIKSFDPYPLLWVNSNAFTAQVENYFSSNNYTGLGNILRFLHIKYVIFTNSYVHNSFMQKSPNGETYNIGSIFDNLTIQIGTPVRLGMFYVFTVRGVLPLIGEVSNPLFVGDSLGNVLNFLGNIEGSSLPKSLLNSLLSLQVNNRALFPLNSKIVYYDGGTRSINDAFTNNYFFSLNGTYVNLNSSFVNYSKGTLNIRPKSIANLTTVSVNTNMRFDHSEYLSNMPGSYISTLQNFKPLTHIEVRIDPIFNESGQRLSFSYMFQNETVSIYATDSSGRLSIGIAASSPGNNPYAWNNLEASYPLDVREIYLNSSIFQDGELVGTLTENTLNYSTYTTYFSLYFNPLYIELDQGHSSENFVGNYSIHNYTFDIRTYGSGFIVNISKLNFTEIPNLKYILSTNMNNKSYVTENTVNLTPFGNLHILLNATQPTENLFFYLFYPPKGSWDIQFLSHKIRLLAMNDFELITKLNQSNINNSTRTEAIYVSNNTYFIMFSIIDLASLCCIPLLYSAIKSEKWRTKLRMLRK